MVLSQSLFYAVPGLVGSRCSATPRHFVLLASMAAILARRGIVARFEPRRHDGRAAVAVEATVSASGVESVAYATFYLD